MAVNAHYRSPERELTTPITSRKIRENVLTLELCWMPNLAAEIVDTFAGRPDQLSPSNIPVQHHERKLTLIMPEYVRLRGDVQTIGASIIRCIHRRI